MEIGPIWRAAMRNRTGPLLIAVQIALTLAVLVNGVFIIQQRIQKMTRDTGMDVANIITVQSFGFGEDFDKNESVRQDLEALRAIAGVMAASSTQHIPLSGSGWGNSIKPAPGDDAPTVNGVRYFMNTQAVEALGVTLAEGRGFEASDIEYPEDAGGAPGQVILTRAWADELFPDGRALGKPIYDNLDRPSTVIGILERMHGAWVSWDKLENVMLIPWVIPGNATYYLVRTEPGMRDRLMPQVEETLTRINGQRVVKGLKSHEEIKAASYQGDRGMAVILAFVTALMVAVTAVGIVGLASFSVRQRVKQIGTRRAIGARRRDIVRYFLLENWLVTTGGVLAGSVAAVAVNYWLVTRYELERLDPLYLPAGILAIWVLGLLAVAGPARRAARISPAVATRTV